MAIHIALLRGVNLGSHRRVAMADVRGALLIKAVQHVPDLGLRLREATDTLELLTGIYEQVARGAATHRAFPRKKTSE